MARLRGSLVLSLAIVALGPSVGTAAAQQPSCGEVVTASVRLEQNLRCPDTNGLVIGAHGITINLNGHGIHQGIGFRGPGSAIDNSGGYDGVVIRNGGLGADGQGIRLAGASNTRIIDVSASGGVSAVRIEGGAGNQILRGDFRGFGGIDVSGSESLRVTDAAVTTAQSFGIRLQGSSGSIARNTLDGGGIWVQGNDDHVADNVVVGALHAGIEVASGANNIVARNWVVDTRPVFSPEDTTGDGIRVGAFTAGTVIRENIAVGNGEDGIDVESSGARLIRNLANDNTDLGIDARPGAFATGNQAAGNGNPAQCAGISCG
jgi:parallel beta-helix repeat protein